MKITDDVREYAREQGYGVEEALTAGMEKVCQAKRYISPDVFYACDRTPPFFGFDKKNLPVPCI